MPGSLSQPNSLLRQPCSELPGHPNFYPGALVKAPSDSALSGKSEFVVRRPGGESCLGLFLAVLLWASP